MQVTSDAKIKFLEAVNKKGRDKVKFVKTEYQLRLSFVIYADIESVLYKQDSWSHRSQSQPIPPTNTNQYQHHVQCESWILDQFLAAATIYRQHLANKIPVEWLVQEQWREYNNTTIIWRINKEVQLNTHVTWINVLIRRNWKFNALFTFSKVYCFRYEGINVIAIFTIVSFWNLFW